MIFQRTLLLATLCTALALAGCKTLDNASKVMDARFANADAGMQKNLDFMEGRVGPYDEYVFGLNWAAAAASRGLYKPEHRFNGYLQKVGSTIALASHYPYTYDGYTFAVLDTDERTALAVPSGFIFITRGLLAVVQSEDELAAVLAHEIAHHELRHNMLDAAAGKAFSVMRDVFGDDRQAGQNNIMDEMAIGYKRVHETEADRRAVELLALSGYQPQALVRVL